MNFKKGWHRLMNINFLIYKWRYFFWSKIYENNNFRRTSKDFMILFNKMTFKINFCSNKLTISTCNQLEYRLIRYNKKWSNVFLINYFQKLNIFSFFFFEKTTKFIVISQNINKFSESRQDAPQTDAPRIVALRTFAHQWHLLLEHLFSGRLLPGELLPRHFLPNCILQIR